jgi:hypothetical protein
LHIADGCIPPALHARMFMQTIGFEIYFLKLKSLGGFGEETRN